MATTNRDINDMMRRRAKDMADGPEVEVKVAAVDPDAASESEETSEKYQVLVPGEPSTGEKFEYEPLTDVPGAWAVYPPGVPCDENEYRVLMSGPAAASDFSQMEKAITDAGGSVSDTPASGTGDLDGLDVASEGGGY